MENLFGGGAPAVQVPAPPPPPPPVPTIDQARQRRDQADELALRRGRKSTIKTGPEGVGSPSTAKTLFGS